MSLITSICAGCGKKIIWGLMENGTKVPLDPTPATYVVHGVVTDKQTTVLSAGIGYHVRRANQRQDKAVGQAYVSHFATCPKAQEFSGSRRT